MQGTAFAQGGANNEEWHEKATCHHCSKKGHIRPTCPKLNEDEDDSDLTNKDESCDSKPPKKTKDKKKKKKGGKKKSSKVVFAQKRYSDSESSDEDSDD